MKQLTCIIIGAGSRGRRYSRNMNLDRDKFCVVGVAEPVDTRRNFVKDMYDIPEENCYESWEPILDRPKFADFAVIATQDEMHFEPAMKAIELGYDLLLEKPISPSPLECKLIAEAAEKKGVKVVVCHVLRYTPLFIKIKDLILSGEIGEVVSLEALEPVGIKHMSHSFVRGAWRNSDTSCPMILAKSCHDVDLIQWLIGKECKKVHSFGSLRYFRKENKPEGAPKRCIDGCPHAKDCIFDTAKLYQGEDNEGGIWFKDAAALTVNATEEEVEKALRNTSYGYCVFDSDNNVVDHQVVNMEFEDGVTASFTMTAFTPDKRGREMRIFGTKGIIEIFGKNDYIYVTRYADSTMSGEKTPITFDVRRKEDKDGIGIVSGHGGGDGGIIDAIYYEFNNAYTGNSISTGHVSYINHLISFAAEKSRVEGTVVDIDEYADSL
ncbi:MAG: Gfo/Idh/MocA family oxidoreductase [Clostridia bacterium]|nr:Gfo/Idh/MocA family oxidoreductase [Clostridia bacterium]